MESFPLSVSMTFLSHLRLFYIKILMSLVTFLLSLYVLNILHCWDAIVRPWWLGHYDQIMMISQLKYHHH